MSAAWDGYEQERRARRNAGTGATAAAGGFGALPRRPACCSWARAAHRPLPVARRAVQCGRPRPGAAPRAASGGLADAALVVYNENDPASRELAQFYAGKRGIAEDRVVALRCSTEEEISREDYDSTIAAPLRRLFDARGWWTRGAGHPGADPSSTVLTNRIRFIALVRGMPLKIRATPAYEGDPGNSEPPPMREQNAASVDSELAVLGFFTRAIAGMIPNPYFRSYRRIDEAACPRLMLVTRLDAPTGAMVRRMITDSLAAEKTGLWGRCYLDTRGLPPGSGGMAEGDAWISKIRADTAPHVLPTIIDKRPETFTREYPMTEAALYFGWYTGQVAGPFSRPEFRFQPGAVACHLHSFSAVSVRTTTDYWVGPLLDQARRRCLATYTNLS